MSGRPIFVMFGPILPWKIFGNVLMLSRLSIEGVWKVLVGCLESAIRVSGRWMEGVLSALIGGCLEGV